MLCNMLVSSNSQVKKFGKPTWRKLVEAVEDKVGGDNPALAQTIAKEHPGTPGNHVYSSLATYVGDELSVSFVHMTFCFCGMY